MRVVGSFQEQSPLTGVWKDLHVWAEVDVQNYIVHVAHGSMVMMQTPKHTPEQCTTDQMKKVLIFAKLMINSPSQHNDDDVFEPFFVDEELGIIVAKPDTQYKEHFMFEGQQHSVVCIDGKARIYFGFEKIQDTFPIKEARQPIELAAQAAIAHLEPNLLTSVAAGGTDDEVY